VDFHERSSLEPDFKQWFACVSAQILNCQQLVPYKSIKPTYYRRLVERGLGLPCGRIDQRALRNQTIKHYGREFLASVGCDLDADINNSWLANLIRPRDRINHPIQHLLFIGLLFESLEDFLFHAHSIEQIPPEVSVDRERENVNPLHTQIIKHLKMGKSVTQTADFAGCHSHTVNAIGRRHKLICTERKKLSRPTDKILLKALISAKPIRQISKEFGVAESTLGYLLQENPNAERIRRRRIYIDRQKFHRRKFVQLLTSHPETTRNQLWSPNIYRSYLWLRKHDKKWLAVRLPKEIRSNLPKASNQNKWSSLDVDLSRKIQAVVDELLARKERLVRITLNRIEDEVRKAGFLGRNLNRLPKSKALLDRYLETVDQFQIRRIRLVTERLQETGQITTIPALRKAASIKHGASEEVHRAIRCLSKQFLSI
jgi:hypothetical protein